MLKAILLSTLATSALAQAQSPAPVPIPAPPPPSSAAPTPPTDATPTAPAGLEFQSLKQDAQARGFTMVANEIAVDPTAPTSFIVVMQVENVTFHGKPWNIQVDGSPAEVTLEIIRLGTSLCNDMFGTPERLNLYDILATGFAYQGVLRELDCSFTAH